MASGKAEDSDDMIKPNTTRKAIYEQREAVMPTLARQRKDLCLPSSSAMPFSSSPPPSDVAPLSIHLSSSVGTSSELSDVSNDDDGDYDDHLCRGWHFSPRAATPTPFQPILLSRPGSLDTSRQLQDAAAAAATTTYATAIPSPISTVSPATPLAGHAAAAAGQQSHFLLSAKLSALTLGEAHRDALQGPPYDYDDVDDGFVFQPTPPILHRASISTSPSSPLSPSHCPSRSSPRALKHATSTTSLNAKAKAKAQSAKQLIERVSSTVKNVVTRKSQRGGGGADEYGTATIPHSPLGIKTTVTTTRRSEPFPATAAAAAAQHRYVEQEQASDYGPGQYSSSPLAEAQSLLSTSLPRSTVTAASSAVAAAAPTPLPRGPSGALHPVRADAVAGSTLCTMAEETAGRSRLHKPWSTNAEASSSVESVDVSMAARWSRAAQGGGEVWHDSKEDGPVGKRQRQQQQQPSLARLVAMEEGEVKWGHAM